MKFSHAIPGALCVWAFAALFSAPLSAQEQETQAPETQERSPWAIIDDGSKLAFEFTLEGSDAPPIRFTEKYWDDYLSYYRAMSGIQDEGVFLNRIFKDIIRSVAMQLYYHEELPALERRANQIIRKLNRGQTFEKLVKQFSENVSSRALGGGVGVIKPGMMYYPVDKVLFETEVGKWTDPMFTYAGLEIFMVDKRTGEIGTLVNIVQPRYILLRYASGGGLSGQEKTSLLRRVRVRTGSDRFRRILPPGMQLKTPGSFGPEDIAPLGEPRKPLTQCSDLDERHNKVLTEQGGGKR